MIALAAFASQWFGRAFGWIGLLGRWFTAASTSAGYGVILLGQTTLALPHVVRPRRIRNILDLAFTYSTVAIPVTVLVSIFSGMILALNSGLALREVGQENWIGRFVAVSMVREMGPLMTGLILAASIGSSIAAEIGTMRVSEEIDALEIMSISPVRFLVLPRVVSLTLVCPVMTIFSAILGIIGGALISTFQFRVSIATYQNDALELLKLKDIYTGMLKALIFGLTIAAVGAAQGMLASGGATGVGHATRRAVVTSFLLILVFGYYVTWFFYR